MTQIIMWGRMINKYALFSTVALIALSGCSSEPVDVIPSEEVPKLQSGDTGIDVPENLMIAAGYEPFWKEHVVTGYPDNPHQFMPGQLIAIEDGEGCEIAVPDKNHSVSRISLSGSTHSTNVKTWTRKDLKLSAETFVENYKKHGEEQAFKNIKFGSSLKLVNVFVTDNDRPNHLILSSDDDVLWNIQTDNFAKISGITLISNGVAGLANIASDVQIQTMASKKATNCGFSFGRKPNETWDIVQQLEGTTDKEDTNSEENLASEENVAPVKTSKVEENIKTELEDIIQKHRRQYSYYNKWHIANYGLEAGADVLEVGTASNILIGDFPKTLENRIKYKSIEGSVVYVTGGHSIMLSTKEQYKTLAADAVSEKAKELVGGDLSVLKSDTGS